MSELHDFYLRQVALSAEAADNAALANQRDTFLRAQAAWQVLADRAGKTAAGKVAAAAHAADAKRQADADASPA